MRAKIERFSFHWARLFYVYGKEQRSSSLIPFLCQEIKRKKALPALRSGQDCLDFIHVEDVADALFRLCTRNCPTGVYNIGSGTITKASDIAEFLLSYSTDPKATLKQTPETTIPHDCKAFWADISGTTKLINWIPRHPLQQSLKRALDEFN